MLTGGSNARAVPPLIVDQTIGRTPIVVGTLDVRLYDATVGLYLRIADAPLGFIYLSDADGSRLTDDDGAYLMEAA